MWDDIFIYVPAANEIIRIAEGTGCNLLDEDLEEGYVDYIYYDQHSLEIDMPINDGGQIMTTSLLHDIYNSIEECIPEVLNMAYGTDSIDYILLKKEINDEKSN